MGLVGVVMAIILSTALITSSMNYLPIENQIAKNLAHRYETALVQLEGGWMSYVGDHRTYESQCEVTDPEGNCIKYKSVVDEPGYLDQANWKSELIPNYVHEPVIKGEMLSYHAESGEHYFCLVGSSNEAVERALKRLQNRTSSTKVTINENCGASQSGDYDGAFAVTYRLQFQE